MLDKFLTGAIIGLGSIAVTLLYVALLATFAALPIMWLWNGLLPVIFGLPTITFLQALGLFCLSRCFVPAK